MVDENAVAEMRDCIKAQLRQLACKLKHGEDDELLIWIIPDVFACAHRPLRYHHNCRFCGSGKDLPPDASPEVRRWVDRLVNEGIRSVICLLSLKELLHYAGLDLGTYDILALYRKSGLLVCHLPWDDPKHAPREGKTRYKDELQKIRNKALTCFDCLPKPVLIHCSAGQDRSAPVAAYIHEMRLTVQGSEMRPFQ